MSEISNFHPLFGNSVLSTDKVMELIRKGDITWEDLTDEQIQPNTIDVRIGRVEVYNGDSDGKRPDAVYEGEKDEPIVIPSRSRAMIGVYDKIGFDSDKYLIDIELRSGRGRLQLLPWDNMNFMGINDMWVFNANPNDIVLYGQDRFAQAFFNSSNGTPADGKVIDNHKEVAKVAKRCGVESFGPYVKLTPGDKVLKYRKIGKIDTRERYSNAELFEEYDLPYVLPACEQVLMQSKEVMDVPKDIGIRLLRRKPRSQKSYLTGPDIDFFDPLSFVVNSGWVDSGYKGKITMQPFASLKCVLDETNPTCLGIVYKYDRDASRAYNGHYAGGNKIVNS